MTLLARYLNFVVRRDPRLDQDPTRLMGLFADRLGLSVAAFEKHLESEWLWYSEIEKAKKAKKESLLTKA